MAHALHRHVRAAHVVGPRRGDRLERLADPVGESAQGLPGLVALPPEVVDLQLDIGQPCRCRDREPVPLLRRRDREPVPLLGRLRGEPLPFDGSRAAQLRRVPPGLLQVRVGLGPRPARTWSCLLYTSDAADD